MQRIHHTAILISLSSLLFTLGPTTLAATPVAEQATVDPPPAPTLTISTGFGTGARSTTVDASDTALTFPAVTQSSTSQTTTASDWVGIQATLSNATASTTWAVYASGGDLAESGGSGSIPAADVAIPSTSGNAWAGTTADGGAYLGSDQGPSTAPTLSSSPQTYFEGLSASSQTFLAFQPTLTIPAGTPAGTYTGTLDVSAGVN